MKSPRKMVLVLLLLATALIVGCETRQPPFATPVNTSIEEETTSEQAPLELPESEPSDKEAISEQPPIVLPENDSDEKETMSNQSPLIPEQSGSTSAEQSPVKKEKPLVIVSDNIVLTDRGQLLQALDKEMEALLVLLENMDDIQNEDFDF